MKEKIEIMHIDPAYQITYFIISKGSLVRSSVPIEKARILLERPGWDLIVSEPHNKTILRDPPRQISALQDLSRIRTFSDIQRFSQQISHLNHQT